MFPAYPYLPPPFLLCNPELLFLPILNFLQVFRNPRMCSISPPLWRWFFLMATLPPLMTTGTFTFFSVFVPRLFWCSPFPRDSYKSLSPPVLCKDFERSHFFSFFLTTLLFSPLTPNDSCSPKEVIHLCLVLAPTHTHPFHSYQPPSFELFTLNVPPSPRRTHPAQSPCQTFYNFVLVCRLE